MRFPFAIACLVLLLASGCLGAGSSEEVEAPSTSLGAPTDVANPEEVEPENVFVPKFHTHDYWNGRSEIFLFVEFPLRLGDDVQRETRVEANTVVVGYREFTPASDGEDAGTSDKTDTIFQGTKEIQFTLDWSSDAQIPGVTFYYKSAAGPAFTPMTGLEKGQTYSIPIRKGMADMPHQLQLSRWRFALEAYDPSQDGFPVKAYVARGEIKVTMKLINGGDSAIDPPHPYFFTNGPVRYAGEINQTIASAVALNVSANGQTQQVQTGSKITGWKVENRHIIPWETTHMRVWLHYNYTGTASDLEHKLTLRYADASGPQEKYPTAASNADGVAYFEFPINEAQTDSPYATSSDWAWGVFPLTQGQDGGDFEGKVHLYIQAVKEGDTSDRGMGN